MNDSYKRGFSKGWRDHRDGNPPQTDFSRNNRDYTEGYRQGQTESDYELKRDGREAALMDFRVGVYESNCITPGYQEHYLKLTQDRGRNRAQFDFWNGDYDPDCDLPGYLEYFEERSDLERELAARYAAPEDRKE